MTFPDDDLSVPIDSSSNAADEIKRRIAQRELRSNLAEVSINKLAVGILVLDDQRQIIFENAAATKVLNDNDGLILDDDRRVCALGAVEVRLAAAIQRVIGQTGDSPDGGVALNISRPSGKRAYQLFVTELRLTHAERPVALYIRDPDRTRAPVTIIAQAFGLTAAEIRLFQALLDGHTAVEAAKTLGVSGNTVKTQLRSLFAKTGCSCQADLIQIAVSHPAWFAACLTLANH
jgi:DNA-binding CsgD family transcriptional regulator